jgi:hypothetical protein
MMHLPDREKPQKGLDGDSRAGGLSQPIAGCWVEHPTGHAQPTPVVELHGDDFFLEVL